MIIRSLDEKAFSTRPTESGRIGLAWAKRKGSSKGRGCEILAGMKGWRPSVCPLARRRIGLGEADEFLPDVGSIGLSFPRVLGPLAR
jgi:hypothetical protein